jgi:hypothetical protein
MIIKAITAMAQTIAEAAPTGCDGLEVLLPDEAWGALKRELDALTLRRPMPSYGGVVEAPPREEPLELRLYTQGGSVLVKRAP